MAKKKIAKKKTTSRKKATRKKVARKKTATKKRVTKKKTQSLTGRLYFSVSEVAELFGVTPRSVNNWEVKPKGKSGTRVMYLLPEVIQYVVARAESRPQTSYEYMEERSRLTYHQANIAELDEKVKRDELFDGREVLMLCTSAYAAARNRVLGLHSKIRTLFPDLDQEVIEEIEEQSIELLNDIGTDGIPPRLAERVQSAIRRMAKE